MDNMMYNTMPAAPMVSERERMLKKVMSYQFAAFDLSLYLDTHPTDKRALAMYSDLVKKSSEAKAEYMEKYGPLTAEDSTRDPNRWRWIDDPWPWDNI